MASLFGGKKKKKKSFPIFNPRLGKAVNDIGLLNDFVRIQIDKWKLQHASVEQDIATSSSLTVTMTTFARSMEMVGNQHLQQFKDVQKSAIDNKRTKLKIVIAAISDLTRILSVDIEPLESLVEDLKIANEKRDKMALKRKVNLPKLELVTNEINSLEKKVFRGIRTCKKKLLKTVLHYIQRFSKNGMKAGTKRDFNQEDGDDDDESSAVPNFYEPPPPKRYAGEGIVLKLEKVAYKCARKTTLGCLYATNFRAIFLPYIHQSYEGKSSKCPWYSVPHASPSASSPTSTGSGDGNGMLSGIEDYYAQSANLSWFEVAWICVVKFDKTAGGRLLLWSCDMVSYKLDFTHSALDTQSAMKQLEPLLRSGSGRQGGGERELGLQSYFAFWHQKKAAEIGPEAWFDWAAEYKRLGIPDGKTWVIYRNAGFQVSPTYPELLVVPMHMYSHQIARVAQFRSKLRFPVLTWRISKQSLRKLTRRIWINRSAVRKEDYRSSLNKKKKKKKNTMTKKNRNIKRQQQEQEQATSSSFAYPDRTPCLLRCAQPHSGLTKRCELEENMLVWIGQHTCPHSKAKNMVILDCRPKLNAMANICKGGGWESTDNYKSTVEFLNIANIHAVRDSFTGLRGLFYKLKPIRNHNDHNNHSLHHHHHYRASAAAAEDVSIALVKTVAGGDPAAAAAVAARIQRYRPILKALRKGKESWFDHLATIIDGANRIVDMMTVENVSVLVHCSDGWDRTSQVAALAQLQMDPHYRTMLGFSKLIEKDWIGFGHMFGLRNGHGKSRSNPRDKNRSPIFLQWLDAVSQLVGQFPDHFEFNAEFLARIAECAYSCLYGNFLFDCERERQKHFVRAGTRSMWSTLLLNDKYRNKSYVGEEKDREVVLVPSSRKTAFRLFLAFYARWDESQPRSPLAIGDDKSQPVLHHWRSDELLKGYLLDDEEDEEDEEEDEEEKEIIDDAQMSKEEAVALRQVFQHGHSYISRNHRDDYNDDDYEQKQQKQQHHIEEDKEEDSGNPHHNKKYAADNLARALLLNANKNKFKQQQQQQRRLQHGAVPPPPRRSPRKDNHHRAQRQQHSLTPHRPLNGLQPPPPPPTR
eukprot:jgi/Bigna1/68893/fgenesh1_pg.7_\